MEYNFTIREKDKGYQIIVSYKDNFGKWRQKSKQGFPTKGAAKKAGDELLQQVKKTAGLTTDAGMKDITLGQFLEVLIRDRGAEITYSTKLSYRSSLNGQDDLKQMRLIDITYADVANMVNSWNYAPTTKNLRITVLKIIFNYAVSPYKIIAVSPMEAIKQVKKGKAEDPPVFTKKQLDEVLSGMKEAYYEDYIKCMIAAYAGLRLGEVLGLLETDILFASHEINVSKQYGIIGHRKNGIKPPKNKNGYRIVPMPPVLENEIKEYLHNRIPSVDRGLFGTKSATGTMQINKRLKKVMPGAHFHMFRHTYATSLIAQKIDIKTVAALLGDDVKTVADNYLHYTSDMRRQAITDVNEIFG